MEFVKVFDTAKVSGTEVLKEVGHYHDCGADDIAVEWLDKSTKVTVQVSDVHSFLGSVEKYVDEHTYDAWTAQISGAYACSKLPDDDDFKAGKMPAWKRKLAAILKDEREGIPPYEELQRMVIEHKAPVQLGIDVEGILHDERRHVAVEEGYFK